MSENETVVIEQHTSSGQTLKPVFIYSREEYFDAPLPSQKSHQVSTLSVPRESPNIIAMPKRLPSYVMAGEYAVPNAQLVRRRIDYQETAEYRVVRPTTGSVSAVDGRGDVSVGLRKPLTVSTEEFFKRTGDEKLSTGSSLSSPTRRRTRVSIVEPTDRVLRSQNRRSVSMLQRNMNYGIEQETKTPSTSVLEEEGEATFTPLASHSRQAAVRRRATEVEEGEHAYHRNVEVTPLEEGRPPPGAVNTLTSRPWHLSSMLGLSAEPSYRSPSLRAEEERRCHFTAADTSSSSHHTSCLTSSLRCRLTSCLLNLIAIPLVLLHYLSVAITAAGKTAASALSNLYHRTTITSGRGSGSSSTKHSRVYRRNSYDEPGLSYAQNGSKGADYRGHRSQDITSLLCCGRTPSYCCSLFLLLLLLLATLAGFLFRPAEVNPALDEAPFFFGLLPSDAQCIRLAFADSHANVDVGPLHAPHNLRWNCLSWSIWEPSVAALKRQSSVWWDWVKSLFTLDSSVLAPSPPGHPSTQDSYQPITSLEGIDKLLQRLQVIDDGMTDLNRQVTELKQANQDRLDTHTKEYGVISTDVSRLQAAIDSLKQQITLIADKVTREDGDDQHRQRIIDDLVEQATFVSTASLDARLQELRKQLEAMINKGVTDSITSVGDQQVEQIERFEKTLGELRALVVTQKSEMETKLKNLRQEFEAYKKEKAASLEALNAKIAGDVVSAATESHKNLAALEERLVADVEKISIRVGSIERLNKDLEQALQKLIAESAPLRQTEASQSVSKERLEELIEEMKNTFSEKITLDLRQKITEELARTTDSGPMTQTKLINLIRSTVDERLKETFANAPQSTTGDIPAGVLSHIDSIFEVFTADGTGKADFALESAGGTVVSTRCTRTYTSFKSAVSLFGITLAYWSRSPNEILQPSNHPGECWCFHGSEGQAIVRLAMPVHVTGVSLEHIPKSLAHTGRIDSAPRDFLIKALKSDSAQDGDVLGSFTYNAGGKPIQYFPVKARSDGKPTVFVELAITSNHGHPEYTCVYRLRVHGHLATEADAK
ncbi:SUN domain containing protein 1 [Echinococcus multilocularis]|uniref:SUN domain containing protein 1 n=1 Tax=Echinococcus multilocularis TaxID=6211 RepID=A0A068Y983_ECHMU|nr:SUN domain containing protein 1 [Echinococcus multilocularis]